MNMKKYIALLAVLFGIGFPMILVEEPSQPVMAEAAAVPASIQVPVYRQEEIEIQTVPVTEYETEEASEEAAGTEVSADVNTQPDDDSYREGLAAYITSVNHTVTDEEALTMVDCMLDQAAQHEVDEKLIMAVAHTESTFYSDAVSYADYKGLMQTGDVLAEEAGYSPDALFDPEVSIAVGTEYICDQLESFDQDVCLALTAYNQGPGAVYGGTYDTDYAELTMRRVENIKTFLAQGGYSQP